MVSGTDLKHKLAAILAADAVGYSRLMAADERATVAALDAARAVFGKQIEANQGRVVDMAGDSVLAVFETAAGAVGAALAVQKALAASASGLSEDCRLRFRIGVHLGDVIEKADGTVYGDGVNIAARLERLAEPGGVAVSDSMRNAVKGKVAAIFEDLGEQKVKNIAEPIRAYRWMAPERATDPTAIAHKAVPMSTPVPGFGGRPAVAVLPFDNLSGDPEQEYFADGLAEDILTRLAMWRWVPVIARNSSFTYKGRAVDVKQVGRALGARYVLEGSVRRGGNRVRVTAQLIDAETSHNLWAEKYDRSLDDLFAIQDELTEGIANALEAVIGTAEQARARRKPPASLDAWDAFQRGMWHLSRLTREDFTATEPLFRRATELDPGFAPAIAGIAAIRVFEGFFLWSPPATAFGEAVKHAQAALRVDPMDAMASAVLGVVLAFTGRLDEALEICRRAVELNPSLATAYQCLSAAHMFRGETREAIKAGESAVRISPNDALLHIWLSVISANYYLAREYERAVKYAKLTVRRAPHYGIGWRNLANALGQLGRLDEAREALAKFLELMPGYTTEAAARASVGFRDEALFQHYLEGLRKAGWQG